MCNSVIIVVLISSVIDINSAGFALVNSCFKFNASLWTDYGYNGKITTIWCENKCKYAVDKFLYYGTKDRNCYCRQTELYESEKMWDGKCNKTCLGNLQEKCEGVLGISVAEMYVKDVTIPREAHVNNFEFQLQLDERDSFKRLRICNRPSNTVTAEVTLTTSITTASVVQPITTTSMQMLSTDTSPPTVTNGIRTRKLLCKCPKRLINTKWHFLDGKNITDAEVKKMVVEDFNKNIKSEISVDKKTVSKEVRKKNSSVNKRKSSQSIGSGCVVFLVLPVVFLIATDILNCCIHFQSRIGDRKRNKIGPTSDIQDSRDSSKPLHENVNITESYYASRCSNDFYPDEVKLETYRRERDGNNEEDRDEWLQYM